MKIYIAADIVNNQVIVCGPSSRKSDVQRILTNLDCVPQPRPDKAWKIEIEIGLGPSARHHMLDLSTPISMTDSLETPLLIGKGQLIFCRDRLFVPERPPRTISEIEEVLLRTKKIVYDEEAELVSLRAAVANTEAAIEYSKSGPKREPIPEEVKLLVWTRDGGACVRCASKQDLQFDHVIPVAKGGGNVAANIQILCQPCNLKKSDKIAT